MARALNGIIFYGDPHGEWTPLLKACTQHKPEAVVIVGDCDLAAPLREVLAALFQAGIRVRWIHGNHDNDTEEWHDRLWVDYPEGNLHGRWEQLGGSLVGGLGGIYKERVWYPRFDSAEPVYKDRRAFLKQVSPAERWRGGLPLRMRDTIFPEDARSFEGLRLDVLVTHEAPSNHRHGFVGIDHVAAACRAKLVVHGHHHQSYEGSLPSGTQVRGLAKAEVFRL